MQESSGWILKVDRLIRTAAYLASSPCDAVDCYNDQKAASQLAAIDFPYLLIVKRLLDLLDYFTGDSSYGDDIRRNPFVPAGIVTVAVVVLPPDGMLVCKGLQAAGFRVGDSRIV
jgi:hypothetical protein